MSVLPPAPALAHQILFRPAGMQVSTIKVFIACILITYQPSSLLFHGVQQLGKLFEGLSWRRKIELLIHLHLLVKVQIYSYNLIHVSQ